MDSIAVEPRNFSVRSEIAHWVDGYGERAVEGDTYPLILPDTANQTIVHMPFLMRGSTLSPSTWSYISTDFGGELAFLIEHLARTGTTFSPALA